MTISLATNVLDAEELSNDDILREYKAQQSTERGFRFLKDPLFFTSSVFLNSTQRVAALAMVMGLCLLVYSLGQKALRQNNSKFKIINSKLQSVLALKPATDCRPLIQRISGGFDSKDN